MASCLNLQLKWYLSATTFIVLIVCSSLQSKNVSSISTTNGGAAARMLGHSQPHRPKSRRQLLDDDQDETMKEVPNFQKKSSLGDGIRMELMHRDHHSSPLHHRGMNLTLAERIRRDVMRSKARASFLSSKMMALSREADHGTVKATNVAASSSSTAGIVSTDTFESPLSATIAEYVMSLSLGTPPQKFDVVVDTGSDLVWVQCTPCAQCFQQIDPIFNPTQSSSYQTLTCSDAICNNLGGNLDSCSPNCQYTYDYSDLSSTSGDFSTETVTLSTTSGSSQAVLNFAFGCGHNNQGPFSSSDGLVGLGQGLVSFSSQLGALFGNMFSYCLVAREQALSQTSPLLFGDAALPSVTNGLQFTPILPSSPGLSSLYYVGLEGLSVAGALLNIQITVFTKDSSGNGGTIFDSGTTFTQLASPAYDAMLSAFQAAVPYSQIPGAGAQLGLELCFDIAGVPNVAVPELTFHFTNADFNLPAPNIFVLVDTAGTMCLAFSRSSSALNIFGNTQQQNFQILYDRVNTRIGFTPVTCSSL
ncbi:unnamed protein product [Calypogeia fissa]